MRVQPEVLTAATIVIVTVIVVIGLVAVLAPAALSSFVRPLLDTINKLIDLLRSGKEPPDEPPPSA